MSSHQIPNSMAMHRLLMSASYSATLLEEGKWTQTMYLMRTLRGEMKTSPVPAPFFISDPLKYIVQYSWSMTIGGIWILVHSAMKSDRTWDLMVVRGAYEIP